MTDKTLSRIWLAWVAFWVLAAGGLLALAMIAMTWWIWAACLLAIATCLFAMCLAVDNHLKYRRRWLDL